MKIATWNIRGLLEESKFKTLERDLIRYNLDILAVQETHIRGTDKKLIGNKYTFYHTGPTNHSHHGVGIIVRNQYKRLQSFATIVVVVVFFCLFFFVGFLSFIFIFLFFFSVQRHLGNRSFPQGHTIVK